MRVTIIGTGDLKIISEYSKLSKKELQGLLEDSAKLLAEIKAELIILPARGIPYEFAKLYKKFGGKNVIGLIPAKCPFYGTYTTKIIGRYLDVIDEKIEFDSWYDVDGNIATLGDFTICFGLSAGTMAEISLMKYNLMYKERKTKLIVFENTISRKFHQEIEEDIKPIYINSIKELRKILKS
jgi:hypothetical protein